MRKVPGKASRRALPDGRKALVRTMIRKLDRLYGGEAWDRARVPRDPLDDLVRTILSQNTTDGNRDRAFEALRSRYRTWEAATAAPVDHLKETIAVAGLANSKGPAIQSFLSWLKQTTGRLSLDFLKDLPADEGIALLVQHKGVGVKTAAIVLAFSCGKDLCAVDTHVHRILRRVGVVDPSCGREKAYEDLRGLIPKGKARSFHVNLIDFGKNLCTARSPQCPDCPMSGVCRFYAEEVAG